MVVDNSNVEFDAWYETTCPRLIVSLAAAFGDPDLPHEAVAEAMTQAYQQWNRVVDMDSPDGWVYRVALNVARKKIRRQKIERRILSRMGPPSVVTGPAGEIWQLVADLPPRQRLAIVLRHVGHLNEADVAAAMGITRGTVSATLRSAYSTLRLVLDEPQLATEKTI